MTTSITSAILETYTGAELVAKYNELTNSEIKKFTDKKTAIARIIKVVAERAASLNDEIVLPIETTSVIQHTETTTQQIDVVTTQHTETGIQHTETTTTTTQSINDVVIQHDTPSLLDSNDIIADAVIIEEAPEAPEAPHVEQVEQVANEVAVVQPKKRGRKPNVDGVPAPKKEAKVRGVSKEMRLVHLFVANPGKEISLVFAKMVFEGASTIEEAEAVKTSSFNCVLAYIRNSITGFGMRIEKSGKNVSYDPQRNTQNWHARRAHIKGLLSIVQNAIDNGTYTAYELPTE